MNDKPALNELPALLAEELARIDGLNPVTGGIIRGILDDAVARAAKLEEAKTYWRDRAETAEALAYERLESAVFAEQRANDAEVERDELRDANSVLSDALETTRQTLVTLTARVAELEAALAAERAWSSASEPPEESGDYIGYDGKSVMCVKFDAHEDADEDWPWADMDGTFVPVTRWQVLPPAPQEPR